jgi:hypothetical protein
LAAKFEKMVFKQQQTDEDDGDDDGKLFQQQK